MALSLQDALFLSVENFLTQTLSYTSASTNKVHIFPIGLLMKHFLLFDIENVRCEDCAVMMRDVQALHTRDVPSLHFFATDDQKTMEADMLDSLLA